MRYLAALMAVVLVGCDDPVGPEPRFSDETILARIDLSKPVTGLIAFNDAGQALWSEDRRAFFWDGSGIQQLSFDGIDLGPDGSVIGREPSLGPFVYWKGGEKTEIPLAYGIDGRGRVYVETENGFEWWTPESGFSTAPSLPALPMVRAVGDDGSIIVAVWPDRETGFVYYRSTIEEGLVEIEQPHSPGVLFDHSAVTENGLIHISTVSTRVIDTRENPWEEHLFEFESSDMNNQMTFVTMEGEIINSSGEILATVEAVNTLINDNNEILVMSPEGEIKIIR